MAHKNTRKLQVKKETLRDLTSDQLRQVAGGLTSSILCQAGNESGRCGSTTETPRIIGYDQLTKAIYSYSG